LRLEGSRDRLKVSGDSGPSRLPRKVAGAHGLRLQKRQEFPLLPPPHEEKMNLRDDLVGKLSSRGILAYVAVAAAGDAECSTATLAGLVRCQTAVMREGLQELAAEAPEAVRKSEKAGWICGTKKGESPILDSSMRYKSFIADLKTYWDFLNPTIPFSIGSADGAAIRQFLRNHREWGEVEWRTALQNRGRSVRFFGNGSRTEDFYRWIMRLADYLGGPLNQFNKPVEGMGNAGKAIAIEQHNEAAAAAYLAGD
jgi:hypothetical protein